MSESPKLPGFPPDEPEPSKARDTSPERSRSDGIGRSGPPGRPMDSDSPSAMSDRFNLFFRWFSHRYFGHFELDADVVTRLRDLETRGTVVYVMRYSSRLDYFLFNALFLQHGLRLSSFANAIRFHAYRPLGQQLRFLLRMPLRWGSGRALGGGHEADLDAVRGHVSRGDSLFLFLRTQRLRSFLRRRKSGKHNGELDLIEEVIGALGPQGPSVDARSAVDREVFFVPLAIFWRKGPRNQNRFLNVDYGSLTRPSDFAKVARFLSTYRSLAVKVGEAIDLRRFLSEHRAEDREHVARKIRRAILIHLYREEKVVEGPALPPRWRVLREVLRDAGVREAMRARASGRRGSPEKAEREVERIFREISSHMSSTWLALGAWVVGGLFRRLFASIEVHRLAEVAEAAKRNPIVLVPSHRSYFDFLILSWLFYQNYLVPPHIAARENMAFGPFGFLFRRMGAFFLRRSFDDPLYKEVFRAYVAFLVREGFTQEFFIEGGRSRTGKMLAPRLGMLGWDVDAFLEGRRRDLFFVPIAISYERLVEESGMVEELSGGQKTKESVWGLLRARKYLRRRFGTVHVSFGEPISLARSLGEQRRELRRLVGEGALDDDERGRLIERKRVFIEQLGHSLVERIGLAMVANATSVAAVVMLGQRSVGLRREELVAEMQRVAELLMLQGVRLTPAFERDLGELKDSLGFLLRSDLLESRRDARGEIVYFEEPRRRALDIYRNSIVHFLVLPSILARAALAGCEEDEVHWQLETWMDVFYREYYASNDLYLSRGEALLDHMQREGWIERDGSRWVARASERGILEVLAEQTRGVIEGYDVVVGLMRDGGGVGKHAEILIEAHEAFENACLLGRARRPEAATDSTFENALAWLTARDILAAERIPAAKRGGREIRYARGEKFDELASIDSLLANALADR